MVDEKTYRFNGPQAPQMGAVSYTKPDGTPGYKNKGVLRAEKARKRLEAETRNAMTPDSQRKKNRVK